MDLLQVFNAGEAVLWMGLALIAAFGRIRGLRTPLRIQFVTFFLLFAASEWIEIRTGAWWRPWWLAVWKGVCIVMLVGAFVRLKRNRNLT